jgi:hypothetical protein
MYPRRIASTATLPASWRGQGAEPAPSAPEGARKVLEYPALAAQWHPTKNPELTPVDVLPGSHQKVWWKCPKGSDHVWQAVVNKRTISRRGCPFCAGKSVSVTNSLASLFPDLAAEWHPTKNGKLTPDKIVAGSEKQVWWKCPNDHEWQVKVDHRTRSGSGCPYCSGRQATSTNSLAAFYPNLAAEWHPLKNEDLTPDRVSAGSGRMDARSVCLHWYIKRSR